MSELIRHATVLTLIEDDAHRWFLTLCSEIISELNGSCFKVLDIFMTKARGKQDIVHNYLPSALLLSNKRLLLAIDLDEKNENELIRWVVDNIDGRETKAGWKVKVVSQTNNVVTVTINGNEKIIVVLPLGLQRGVRNRIERHAVEDYQLLHFQNEYGHLQGVRSKDVLNQVAETLHLNQQQLCDAMRTGIALHREDISKSLHPLWVTNVQV